MPSVQSLDSTEGEEHTDRLERLEQPLCKRVPRRAGRYFRYNEFNLVADRQA